MRENSTACCSMKVVVHGYANDMDGWLNDFEMPNGKIISSGLRETFREVVKKAAGGFFAPVTATELSRNGRDVRTHRRRLQQLCTEAGLLASGRYFDERTGKERRGYFLVAHEYVERRYRWEEQHEKDKHRARYRYGGQYIFEIPQLAVPDEDDFRSSGKVFDSKEGQFAGIHSTATGRNASGKSACHPCDGQTLLDGSAGGHPGNMHGLQASECSASSGEIERYWDDRPCEEENSSHHRTEHDRGIEIRGDGLYGQRPGLPAQRLPTFWVALSLLSGEEGVEVLGGALGKRDTLRSSEEGGNNDRMGRDRLPGCQGIPLPPASGLAPSAGFVPEIPQKLEEEPLFRLPASDSTATPNLSQNERAEERIEGHKNCQDFSGESGHFGDKLGTKCPLLADCLDREVNNETLQTPRRRGEAAVAAERENALTLGLVVSDRKDWATEVWEKTRATLKERLGEGTFCLWIAPISALMIGQKLTLDCPDEYFADYVDRHFGEEIRAVLQAIGIDEVSFSSGVKKQRIQREKKEERQHRQQRQDEAQRRDLANLSLEGQFKLLIGIEGFPRKENGFPGIRDWTDKVHLFWKKFCDMSKSGSLPDIADLLKELEMRKQSAAWRQAEGQYILSPDKWLAGKTTKRPWLKEGIQ